MQRNTLLGIIAFACVGIFVFMAINYHEKQQTPMQKLSNSVGEVTEEIKDEIDDNTTN